MTLETTEAPTPDDLLSLLEDGRAADALSQVFDCATLGRIACTSRRGLKLNDDTGQMTGPPLTPFAKTWRRAAVALDVTFPWERAGNIEFDRNEGPDQWRDSREGGDPRLPVFYPAFAAAPENKKRPWETINEAVMKEAVALWTAVKPMKRVSLMVNWQSAVATKVRAIPADFASSFYMFEVDLRFLGHYMPTGYGSGAKSPAMDLILRQAYVYACAIERRLDGLDVFVNGWDPGIWFGSSKRDAFWMALTDDNVRPPAADEDFEPLVCKEKALQLCSPIAKEEALAPLLGRAAARSLMILRGEEDLPAGWEDMDWDGPFLGDLDDFEPY